MFTSIPKSWRHNFNENVTLRELNDALVTLHVPAIVIIMTLMIIGIIGNIVVLGIYFPYPKSFSRVFILWLGFIDLIACCLGAPLMLVSLYHPYEFPVEACKTFRFVHVFLVAASVFIFVFIAAERHRAICNFEVVEMKTSRMHMMCLISCMFAIVVAFPAVFLYGERTVKTGVFNITGIECFVEDQFEETIWPKVYFPFQFAICLIAFVILVILYIKIGRQLNWHLTFSRSYSHAPSDMRTSYLSEPESDSPKLPGRGSKTESLLETSFSQDNCSGRGKAHAPLETVASNRSCQIDRVARELTTMFCWLTVIFILSFIPHLAIIVYQMFSPTFTQDMASDSIIVYNVFFRSFVINNMANPVVYFICMRDFRRDCKKLFCKF